MNDAVEVCAICDIAGCYHIRERKARADPMADERVKRLVEALEMAVFWLDYDGRYDTLGMKAALAAIEAQP